MSASQVSLVIMAGPCEGTETERMVALARQAITLDTVDRALTSDAVGLIVVVTDCRSLAEALQTKPVRIEPGSPGGEFHFGQRLRDLISQQSMERVLYIGGGSGALLSAEDINHIAETLLCSDRLVIANNFYSTDFAGFAPAATINSIQAPALDNDLAWLLAEQAGLPCRELPRNAATQLDVDTPTDLITLKPHPRVGPHVRRYLDSIDLATSHVERALVHFSDRDAEVIVAGRVSASTWAYLERETACRVRVFAEERGMRASGRQARGEALSLLGYFLREVGPERFFATLGEMSQAVFLDSRVLLAHEGIWPTPDDRFYSDLRCPEMIEDPWLRDLTRAAMEAPIPIVLGGHSLVSGGLYALVEAAWDRGKDLPRHVTPLNYQGNLGST